MSEGYVKELWDKIGILVEGDGPTYENQVGGYACLHPEARGTVVEFPPKTGAFVENFMNAHFVTGKYKGWCFEGITQEDEYWINCLLEALEETLVLEVGKGWRVNAEKLKDSMEAWIYLKNGNKTGVLFWNNSD